MKKLYIDFNGEWFREDIKMSGDCQYSNKYNRLVIANVKEVIYVNNYIKIYYTDTPRTRFRNLITIDVKWIKNMNIN